MSASKRPPLWNSGDLEQIPCDTCRTDEAEPLFTRPDGMRVVKCPRCGLAYVNPRPKPALISRLYEKDYFQKAVAAGGVGYVDYASEESRKIMDIVTQVRMRALQPFFNPAGKRCLEVGCATGEFANSLGLAGARTTAVDLSEFAISEAQRRYPTVDFRTGGIEAVAGEPAFDAIFAFELLEHVVSPGRFFSGAARLLVPGGLLVLSTPNLDCGRTVGWDRWVGAWTSFEHLYFFSIEALSRIAAQNGFKVEAWLTGAGDGVFIPVRAQRLRAMVRRTLELTGLLARVRKVRAGVTTSPWSSVRYEREGKQHNLLALFKRHEG